MDEYEKALIIAQRRNAIGIKNLQAEAEIKTSEQRMKRKS